ncbi:hypothetical protein SporoP37_02040 [Sporosarcina sp. P37]|uniref:hypothetical protein n=1 Tax=unclassified Sporosarcina TaxID=2647733 RepID=UPI000A17CC1F|nr:MULTISPECIES: hypothetical protein [unclassified Sporosarcina]ARK23590.1 hypothetical protein SporoP37_02040 [Sporosarcina sp. P37]PID18786.1 hypothetical protein CSV62_06710 [Sporosarcina sp. P35]
MKTETNAERFKRIKVLVGQSDHFDDFKWLIQQAERTQELEQLTNNMRRAMQTAYNNTASHPKASMKSFLLHTFEKFMEPELVRKIKKLDGDTQ